MLRIIQKVLNPWVLLGSLVVGVTLVVIAIYMIEQAPAVGPEEDRPAAELAVIPAYSPTPEVILAPTPEPTAAPELPPAPPPGTFAIGALVQIAGTGGDGLNLRTDASLTASVEYLGFETEVFTIVEGPQENDGLTWWRIVGFADESRAGWAAANFLEVVQTP